MKRRFPPYDLIAGSFANGESITMAETRFQAGVIAIRDGMVCLVTNRSGKRWIIPKGTIDSGQTGSEAALKEVWEEAGLLGSLNPDPIGSYQTLKKLQRCHVTVYLLHVLDEAEVWPEAEERQREWMPLEEATRRVEPSGLQALLKHVNPTVFAAVA